MPVQYLTGTPFPNWNTNTVNAAVGKQLDEKAKKALLFYNGEHWQLSDGWGGPRPDAVTTKPDDAKRFMDKIEAAFTSANVLGEVVDRHVSAVMGREPSWQFVPIQAPEGEDEQEAEKDPLVAELEAAIVDWADRRNAHQYLMEAVADFANTGKGMIRLFIPPGLLELAADGKTRSIPTGLDMADALNLVYIEKVTPESSGAAYDRNTMAHAAFMQWNEDVQVDTGQQQRTRTELQYLDVQGTGKNQKRTTVVRTWTITEMDGEIRLELGGNLLMHQMQGKPIVTTQVMQLQKAYNFTLTAMNNNNGVAGFLERIITNAQPPGSYEKDSQGKDVFKTSAYKGGPNVTTFLQGLPITNADNEVTGFAPPGVVFRDPSSPEAFTASLDAYRAAIYTEVKQGHLIAQADGTLSGASRIHLRADFEVSLRDTKVAAEDLYRWLLSTLAKMGALFSGNVAKYDAFRPTVQASLNTGPLTDAERTAVLEQYEKGLRSRENAMVLLGVDDPDAEFSRIITERPRNPVALDTLALLGLEMTPEAIVDLFTRAGLPPPDLAQLKAQQAAKDELATSSAKARTKALNPAADQNPLDTANNDPSNLLDKKPA